MAERFIEDMIASPKKEVTIKVTHNTRKSLSKLLGVSKRDIKFEEMDNAGWGIKIKGYESLNLRLNPSGAMEVGSKIDETNVEYKVVTEAGQIVDPFLKIANKKDRVKVKVNKKGFDPIRSISTQVIFTKEENSEERTFKSEIKKGLRIFAREMEEHQNLVAFVLGGAGVVLTHAVAAGNPEAAVGLKNVLANAGKWAGLVAGLLEGAQPVLYLAETRFGKSEKRGLAKAMQKIRKITNFFGMLSAGYAATEMVVPDVQVNEPETSNIHRSAKNENILHTHSSTQQIVESSNIQLSEEYREPDSHQGIVANTDVQFNRLLTQHFNSIEGGTNWTNSENNVTLANVLTEQTWEYLKVNGFSSHEVDIVDLFNRPNAYLTQDQLQNLTQISMTNNVGEYIDLINN